MVNVLLTYFRLRKREFADSATCLGCFHYLTDPDSDSP